MNELDQAREALSDVLFSHCGECWKWDDCLDDIGARFKCPSMVEQVKCILSLSGPGWRLAVVHSEPIILTKGNFCFSEPITLLQEIQEEVK